MHLYDNHFALGRDGTMYANRTVYTVAPVITLVMVILTLYLHGNAERTFASGQSSFVVDAPEDVYGIWKANGVRGRILVLFDRYPHIRGRAGYEGVPKLSASNVIEFCVFENIIRKIYFIVPDTDWGTFLREEKMRPLRSVYGLERGLFLSSRTGIPIIATTPSSLPYIGEEALVYINAQVFVDQQARDLLKQKQIVSDIIITVRGGGT